MPHQGGCLEISIPPYHTGELKKKCKWDNPLATPTTILNLSARERPRLFSAREELDRLHFPDKEMYRSFKVGNEISLGMNTREF